MVNLRIGSILGHLFFSPFTTIGYGQSENSIYVSWDTRVGVSAAQNSYSSLYMDNIVLNPMFEDASNHNFLLQEGSHMRDAGINYAAHTLTLNSAMSWNAGDGVSLKYFGTSPDMGAFEFQEAPFDPDSDGDGDVDGVDLTDFIGGDIAAHLVAFANAFGTVQ